MAKLGEVVLLARIFFDDKLARGMRHRARQGQHASSEPACSVGAEVELEQLDLFAGRRRIRTTLGGVKPVHVAFLIVTTFS